MTKVDDPELLYEQLKCVTCNHKGLKDRFMPVGLNNYNTTYCRSTVLQKYCRNWMGILSVEVPIWLHRKFSHYVTLCYVKMTLWPWTLPVKWFWICQCSRFCGTATQTLRQLGGKQNALWQMALPDGRFWHPPPRYVADAEVSCCGVV